MVYFASWNGKNGLSLFVWDKIRQNISTCNQLNIRIGNQAFKSTTIKMEIVNPAIQKISFLKSTKISNYLKKQARLTVMEFTSRYVELKPNDISP